MYTICNRLEKLRPPNFVTVQMENQWTRADIMKKWSKLKKPFAKYEEASGLFASEVEILDGFLKRKENQLKLEKAQMLTRRVFKLTTRWKSNDFLTQLKHFQAAMVNVSKASVKMVLKEGACTIPRLPSSQWCSWIIYLFLREVSLLAKIKLECENATKFWLGLIASSHHWGDSLLVTGILSRLWHLSSVIVQEFIQTTYPALLYVFGLLEPTQSSKWPTDEWSAPVDLRDWLETAMKLPFEPANMTATHTGKKHVSSVFGHIFDSDDHKVQKESSKVKSDKASSSSILTFGIKDEEEDFGIPVNLIEEEKMRKRKLKRTDDTKRRKATCKLQTSAKPSDWKSFRKYWRVFFKNYDTNIKSELGCRRLLVRIRKYKVKEADKSVKAKLVKLRNVLRGNVNEPETVQSHFQKFETFIEKRTKRMKKETNI